MLKPGDIAIVSGARTPFGRYCGKLKDFTAQELAAIAAKGAIERAGIDAKEFDHAVFGNAQQTSGDALYGARHVGLRAGLPIETQAAWRPCRKLHLSFAAATDLLYRRAASWKIP
jgi:acetyl-CoA acyltransferase 2